MKAVIYMSVFIVFVELWMIERIITIVLFDSEPRTTRWIITHLRSYVILLSAAVFMLVHATRYLKGKRLSHSTNLIILAVYSAICIYFGMYVSYLDYIKGEQILSFITMILFSCCLLVWRPIISFIVLSATFLLFYHICSNEVPATVATNINLFTTWMACLMISISMYHQRMSEARKDAKLEKANNELHITNEKLEESNSHLERVSRRDELTGIANMRQFGKTAKLMLKEAFEKGQDLYFLYYDIEHFKTYNEQYGFEEGNNLLRDIASELSVLYEGSAYARYSDDHFIVLTSETDAHEKTEALANSLHEHQGEAFLDLKVGAYKAEEGVGVSISIDHARFACNSIKMNAEKHFCIYDNSLYEKQKRKQYIINHLDFAIENEYIEVFYQPVIWTKNKKVCGLEALSRWRDPEYGLLPPGEFIETLEDVCMIHKLDKYVVERVCKDYNEAKKSGKKLLPISLNFSQLDFNLCDMVDYVIDTAKKYNVPKEYLEIEITESALSKEHELLKDAMQRFREKGFNIWLDDFGSGYSSLNVLKDFDFDVLKIDMLFLDNFEENANTKPIINIIINLCKRLNIRSLTEGVETEEEFEFLKEIGCERVQGYYFSKPVPKSELESLIESNKLILSDEL